jgi:hypothetical protein
MGAGRIEFLYKKEPLLYSLIHYLAKAFSNFPGVNHCDISFQISVSSKI